MLAFIVSKFFAERVGFVNVAPEFRQWAVTASAATEYQMAISSIRCPVLGATSRVSPIYCGRGEEETAGEEGRRGRGVKREGELWRPHWHLDSILAR
jgi:hypothetical protein